MKIRFDRRKDLSFLKRHYPSLCLSGYFFFPIIFNHAKDFYFLFHLFAKRLLRLRTQYSSHQEPCSSLTFARARRLAPKNLRIAKAKFEHMLGIVQPSKSSWAAPLRLVPINPFRKTRGLVETFKGLKTITVLYRYPAPHVQSFTFHHFSGVIIFSKIDVVRVYHQIPAVTEDNPNCHHYQGCVIVKYFTGSDSGSNS